MAAAAGQRLARQPVLRQPGRLVLGGAAGNRHLVVVNLSGQPVQARVPLDWPDLSGRSWRLTDILGQSVFERDGGELASPGLFVDLGPWQFHLFALQY